MDKGLVEQAHQKIKETIEVAIDQMKTAAGDTKAIFIGGGAMVVPKKNLQGVSDVVSPSHFEVCGAIGTTIAEIGAYAEGIADLEIEDRDTAIEKVVEKAKDEAEKAGAIRDSVEILDVEEIPFAYARQARKDPRKVQRVNLLKKKRKLN